MDADGTIRPCPGLSEWPRPEEVECDHPDCLKRCSVAEIQPGMSTAYYECRDRHITPLMASLADGVWLFEGAPF